MRIGVFSDPHITRKISYLTDRDKNIIETFREMYGYFKQSAVDIVVCCGDLFDKSRLLAVDTSLVRDVLSIMSMIETYVISGNHDIGSEDSSITDILDLVPNLLPISKKYILKLSEDSNLAFLPYGCKYTEDIPEDSILFTHDEYAGMVVNSLGVLSRSKYTIPVGKFKMIFNGHIHLPSKIYENFLNIGSILPSKFGEMRLFESPTVYIYDTEGDILTPHVLETPYRFYIMTQDQMTEEFIKDLIESGIQNVCLRIDYTDDAFYEEWSSNHNFPWDSFRYVTFRKVIPESKILMDSIISSKSEVQKVNVPEFIVSRVSNDQQIQDKLRESVLKEFPSVLVEEV